MNDDYYKNIYKILVNGKESNLIDYEKDFKNEINNITIIFYNNLNSFEKCFIS